MSCCEINKTSIVEYLTKLGYKPASEKRNEYWYLSPFHQEQTPSFKVNIDKNIWYDFSLGKGGRCIDFIALYFKTDIKGAIKHFINQSFSFHQQQSFDTKERVRDAKKQYHIISEKELTSNSLIKYLKDRKLNIDFCKKYCKELVYKMNDKRYFGVAFKNNLGGYEIRNPYFKGCLINKAITSISYRSDKIRVFESWSDFIAYLTLYPTSEKTADYLILNSLSLLDYSLEQILTYHTVELFLDCDKAGKEATAKIVNLHNDNITDMSVMYANYKDVNEYLKHHNLLAP